MRQGVRVGAEQATADEIIVDELDQTTLTTVNDLVGQISEVVNWSSCFAMCVAVADYVGTGSILTNLANQPNLMETGLAISTLRRLVLDRKLVVLDASLLSNYLTQQVEALLASS